MKINPNRARKALALIDQIIEKCGGPGSGVPGPCPKPGKKPPKEPKKPSAAKPSAKPADPKKPAAPAKKPPKASDQAPKKPVEPKKPVTIDGKPKPSIKQTEMAKAGISVEKGQLKISKPKTAEQAIKQLEIVTKIQEKAMSMVQAAKEKLPEGHPDRTKVLLAAASVSRAFSRTVSQAKTFASKMKPVEKVAATPPQKGGTSSGQSIDLKGARLDKNAEFKRLDEKWSKSLKPDETEALKSYTESISNAGKMRGNSKGKPPKDAKTKALLSAIEKAPKHTEPIFRGLSTSNPKSAEFVNKMLSMKPGDTFSDLGMASHSSDPKIALGFTGNDTKGADHKGFLFSVKPKTATRIANVSKYPFESEVLTKPGAKYRVVGVHKDTVVNGVKVKGMVELEEVDE